MASLYEIERSLEECVDTETGELNVERFEALCLERDTKIGNVARWIINLAAEEKMIDGEIARLKKKKRQKKNRREWLKTFLGGFLRGKKWTDGVTSVSYRKTPDKVEIASEETFIEWAVKNRDDLVKFQTPVIDREKVKEALKNGDTIDGATLTSGTTIVVK